MTTVELFPATGRTHQLRVHCAAAGAPIVGDRKYGGEAAILAALLVFAVGLLEKFAMRLTGQVTAKGAGEILLTSMDRDGTRAGFNLPLTRAISDAVSVPVIASGGVGTLDHLVEGVTDLDVRGTAAGSGILAESIEIED